MQAMLPRETMGVSLGLGTLWRPASSSALIEGCLVGAVANLSKVEIDETV